MPGESVDLLFRIRDDGTLAVLERIAGELKEIGTAGKAAGADAAPEIALLRAAAAEAAKAVQTLGAATQQAGVNIGTLADNATKASQGLDQVRDKASGLEKAVSGGTRSVTEFGAATNIAKTRVTGLAEESARASQGLGGVAVGAAGAGQALGAAGASASGATTIIEKGTSAWASYTEGITGARVAALGLPAAILTAGAAVAAAAANSIKANVGRAAELEELSRTSQVAIADVSRLELVATHSGAALVDLAGGVGSFNRTIADAADGAGKHSATIEKQSRLLKALGVDLRDAEGHVRSGLPPLIDLAAAFQRLPEGQTKSAAAARLFGADAAAMLKAFEGGPEKIRELAQRSDELGLTLTQGLSGAGAVVQANAKIITEDFDKIGDAGHRIFLAFGEGATSAALSAIAPLSTKVAELATAAADLAVETAKAKPELYFNALKNGALEALGPVGQLVRAVEALSNIKLSDLKRFGNGASLALGLGSSGDFYDVESGTSNSTTYTLRPEDALAGPQLSFDERLRREVQAALDAQRKPPSGRGAANRLANLTDQSALGAQQAQVTNAQTALTLAEQELTVFQQRLDLEGVFATTQSARLALLDAGQQQELALAQQIDAAKLRELDAQIAVLEARKQDHDVVEAASKGLTGQLDLLNAQEESLRAQKDLVAGTGGEAARVANEYARARAEIEAANKVTINLGETFSSSVTRAVDGIFNSGSKFDLGNIAGDTAKAIGTSLIGGFIEAEIKKAEFDQMVGENFTVTLPGFMQTGADAIKNIWADAMDFLGFSAQEAGDGVGRSIGQGFQRAGGSAVSFSNTLGGLARNGYVTNVVGTDSAGNAIVQDEFGTSFSSPDINATKDAASGVGSPSESGGGISGLGLAAATYGLAIVADVAINGGERVRQALLNRGLRGGLLSRGDVVEAAHGGGLIGGLARGLSEFDLIIGKTSIFQPPSAGTQRKISLQQLFDKRLLPQQREFDIGGYTGVRTQFLEASIDQATNDAFAAAGFGTNVPGLAGNKQTLEVLGSDYVIGPDGRKYPKRVSGSAGKLGRELDALREKSPEVEALRTNESLALGTILTGNLPGGVNVANALTNNLLLLGVSAKEAKRQLRELADQAGVTLPNAVEEAQRLYLEGKFKDDPTTEVNEKTQQLFTTIEGVVALYKDDLPAGVDVSAIAMKNFTDTAGVEIATFNEDLERAVDIFGRLQQTEEGGLRSGLDAGVAGLAKRNALINAGAPVNEIIKAQVDAKQGLVSSLFESIQTGFTTAITDGLQDSIQDSAPWKALTERIAGAVKGAPLGDITAVVGDLIGASLPQIEAAAATVAALQSQLGVTPTSLTQSADAVKQEIEQYRFNALSPRSKEKFIDQRLSGVDAQITALLEGGITPDEAILLRDLAQQKAELGFQYVDAVGGRYAPGSEAGRRAQERGLTIAEEAEKLFLDIAKEQTDRANATIASQDRATTALDNNTAALDRNTASRGGEAAPAVPGSATPPGAANVTMVVVDATGAPVTPAAARRIQQLVNEMIAGGKLTAAATGKLRTIGGVR